MNRTTWSWTPIAVAEHNGKPIGVAQVKVVDDEADLLKLFVDPSALRSGTGKALLVWVTDVAKKPPMVDASF